MEIIDISWNQSSGSQDTTRLNHHSLGIASDSQRLIFSLVNYVSLCGIISLFGIVANVINMIIFYRQGLNTTINISFFAIAISDLCSLLLQLLFSFYMSPFCEDLNLPIVYNDVQHLTSGLPREAFARITCLITVYITAERCLCITFPLHIKQMITPKRTIAVMCIIYSLTFISFVPLYVTTYIGWKFDLNVNRTLLGIVVKGNYEPAQAAVYFIHGISGLFSFLAVVTLTVILIRKLHEKSSWREKANAHQDKSEYMSNRDIKTMSMVVLIASILIICYTPAVLLAVTTFIEPEFSVVGRYYNLVYILWSFGFLFETINSSVNIFLYLKMSTKYRQTFLEMFPCCLHSNKHSDSTT